jgi:hypothetical protein
MVSLRASRSPNSPDAFPAFAIAMVIFNESNSTILPSRFLISLNKFILSSALVLVGYQ